MSPKYIEEQYSWGTLRKIEVGRHYQIIIHPEEWGMIQGLSEGETIAFKDETGKVWEVSRSEAGFTFRNGGINGRVVWIHLHR